MQQTIDIDEYETIGESPHDFETDTLEERRAAGRAFEEGYHAMNKRRWRFDEQSTDALDRFIVEPYITEWVNADIVPWSKPTPIDEYEYSIATEYTVQCFAEELRRCVDLSEDDLEERLEAKRAALTGEHGQAQVAIESSVRALEWLLGEQDRNN